MRRTLEQAFEALRMQIRSWAQGEAKPDLRVFVYPPEWEALVLSRIPTFAERCAAEGEPIELVDLGQSFLRELRGRDGMIERLEELDRDELLHDLGWIATTQLRRIIRTPLGDHTICRVLTNAGALGTFVSYSSVANEFSGGSGDADVPATVLAFPGEGDERSLNLLRLRVDTNYRVARI
jgi:hypothetical protein